MTSVSMTRRSSCTNMCYIYTFQLPTPRYGAGRSRVRHRGSGVQQTSQWSQALSAMQDLASVARLATERLT